MKLLKLQKPVPPKEPRWQDYPNPDLPNGVNHLGQPIYQKLDWARNIDLYQKALEQYKKDLSVYEQHKLIHLIRNSSDEYCLKNFFIAKKIPK